MKNFTKDIMEIQNRIGTIQLLIKKLLLQYEKEIKKTSKQELLYQQAKLTIGRDASPLDIVNDDLGCAESVSTLIAKVTKFPIITGTWTLNNYMKNSKKFAYASENSGAGTIIICATGTGNGKIRGHAGIMGKNKTIMCNRSSTGIWGVYYSIETWNKDMKN